MSHQTTIRDDVSPHKMSTVSPSPARRALNSKLAVSDADTALTPNRKKSWFGGLRDVVQKGALQAKAAVDMLRHDQQKSEQTTGCKEFDKVQSQPRQSIESATSSAPSTESSARRYHTLTPKHAKLSLRHHLSHHTMKQHKKRNSIFSVTSRSSTDIPSVSVPSMPDRALEESSKRKPSMASSIVGSIRGLNRKRASAPQPEAEKMESLYKLYPAENIPLPSSPIDIPSAAPALDLDLGPAGIMFDASSETERVKEAIRLADPANHTSGQPKSYILSTSYDTLFAPQIDIAPTVPAQILHIEFSPKSDGIFSPLNTAALPTSRPVVDLALEIDGADSDKSDRSRIFERSVTPPGLNARKALRRMCSIDALTEACGVAHAYDDAVKKPNLSDSPIVSDGNTQDAISPFKSRNRHQYRDLSSTSTLTSCPSDMEELSRQQHRGPDINDANRPNDHTEDDPVGTRNLGIGPPSPVRSVMLPFRPKANDAVGDMDTQATGWCGCASLERDAGMLSATEISSSPSPITLEPSLFAQLELNDVWSQQLITHYDVSSAKPTQSLDNTTEEKSIFDHNTPLRTQQQLLATTDIILPDHENNQDNPFPEGLSPHGGPLISRFCQGIATSSNGSPPRTRTTYTAGLGDVEQRFHFENWIRDAATAACTASPDEPRTPRNRSMCGSIESLSGVDERRTPQISPQSSNAERTPSMGDRVYFDLKRSQRNMRYNALLKDSPEKPFEDHGAALQRSIHEPTPTGPAELHSHRYPALPVDENDAQLPHWTLRQSTFLAAEVKEAETELQDAIQVSLDPIERSLEPICSTVTDRDQNSPEPTYLPKHNSTWRISSVRSSRDFTPPSSTILFRAAKSSPARPTGLTVLNPLGPSSSPKPRRQVSERSQSSIGSPLPWIGSRITSTDTLDTSLDLFNSPDSGYQADKSSVSPARKVKPSSMRRYRGLSKRAGGARSSGDSGRGGA